MRALYAFGLVVLIAFLGSRIIFRRKNVLSPLRYFFFSGLIYIFLGLLLGPKWLGVVDRDVLKSLLPLVGFGLGWVGFMFGFQLELRYLKRFPSSYPLLSLFQSLAVLIPAVGILFVLQCRLFPLQPSYLLFGMAVAFGLLTSLGSPTLINAASSSLLRKGRYTHLVRFLAGVSGFWAITGLALLSSFWHIPLPSKSLLGKGLLLLASSVVAAVGFGAIFHILTRKKVSDPDLLVVILGLVFFISGAAFYFNFSPLFPAMVMGLTYSQMTRNHERIYPLLFSAEKPLYIVFLILIGALWDFSFDARTAVLVGALVVLRLLGWVLPLPLLGKALGFPFRLPFVLGLSFLSSGGMGIAMAVSVKLAFPIPLTDVFLSAALLTVILTELASPWALRRSLNACEEEG